MPEFNVTSPDGKTFKIVADSKEEAISKAQGQRRAGKHSEEALSEFSSAADFFKTVGRGAAQGLTEFGEMEKAGSQQFRGVRPEELAPWQRPGATAAQIPQAETGGGQMLQSGVAGAFNPLTYLGQPGMGAGRMALGGFGAGAGGYAGGQIGESMGGPTGGQIGGFLGGMAGGAAGAKAPTLMETRGRGMFGIPEKNPGREAAVSTLRQFGVEPTAGDVTGGRFTRDLERMGGYLGGGGQTAKLKAERQLTGKAADLMGEFGDRVDESMLKRSKERISKDFEDAERVLRIKGTQNLEQLTKDALTLRNEVVNRSSKEVTEKIGRLIDDIMPQEKGERWFINNKTGEVEMSGGAYAQFTHHGSELDRAIHSTDPDVAHYARRVRDLIDDALERTATAQGTRPGVGQRAALAKLKRAREQYFNRLMINRSLADPKEAQRLNTVDPRRLYDTLKAEGWEGDVAHTPLQQLAMSGRTVMSPHREISLGSSHEAGGGSGLARHAAAGVMGALGGAIGYGVGHVPGAILGVTAAPGLAGRVVNLPVVQNYLKNKKYIDAARRAREEGRATPRSIKAIRGLTRGVVGEQSSEQPRIYDE
jgi:hypothetical protein